MARAGRNTWSMLWLLLFIASAWSDAEASRDAFDRGLTAFHRGVFDGRISAVLAALGNLEQAVELARAVPALALTAAALNDLGNLRATRGKSIVHFDVVQARRYPSSHFFSIATLDDSHDGKGERMAGTVPEGWCNHLGVNRSERTAGSAG